MTILLSLFISIAQAQTLAWPHDPAVTLYAEKYDVGYVVYFDETEDTEEFCKPAWGGYSNHIDVGPVNELSLADDEIFDLFKTYKLQVTSYLRTPNGMIESDLSPIAACLTKKPELEGVSEITILTHDKAETVQIIEPTTNQLPTHKGEKTNEKVLNHVSGRAVPDSDNRANRNAENTDRLKASVGSTKSRYTAEYVQALLSGRHKPERPGAYARHLEHRSVDDSGRGGSENIQARSTESPARDLSSRQDLLYGDHSDSSKRTRSFNQTGVRAVKYSMRTHPAPPAESEERDYNWTVITALAIAFFGLVFFLARKRESV